MPEFTETLVQSQAQLDLQLDPMAIARKVEAFDIDRAAREVSQLPEEIAPRVVQSLSTSLASDILQRLPYPKFRPIMDALDSQCCASIFFHFPNHLRELLLLQLDEEKKQAVQEILTFPHDSAGRLMTKDYLVFTAEMLVCEVVEQLRKGAHKKCSDSSVFVIDREQRLIGKVSMRDLLLAPYDNSLKSIMAEHVASVDSFMDRDTLVNEFSSRNEPALPVVDPANHLLGVVRARQILDDVQEGASEDLQQMFGVGVNEQVFSPLGFSLKKRLPWLHFNLAATFLSAFVIGMFEDVIARITVLAIFLPIVSDAGTGSQSMAIVMRGIVMREIPAKRVRKLIVKETFLGLISGIVIGSVTAVIAWLWKANPFLGVVIGLGMIINLSIAGLVGASVPLVLKRMNLDPANCSTMISLAITNVIGFLTFLGLALLFQAHLV